MVMWLLSHHPNSRHFYGTFEIISFLETQMVNMRTYEPVDEDTWSMDYSLAIFLDKAFTKFIEKSNSYPCDLTEDQWKDILLAIRDGFRIYHRFRDFDWGG